ncbi:hypothetical protein SO802_000076 [Lithocarpus litseifolius]|uniref:Uncharacterized protein n=1 Tax=Lithocarpus litseifolius TaxID=425828 RepID=A0AAW2DT96_9ROSI
MASPPFSHIAKPIRSAKTPQSSLCSRTAVASFTPLGLLSFSASGTSAVSGPIPIPITALMSLSIFSIPVSGRRSFSDRNLGPVEGSLLVGAGFDWVRWLGLQGLMFMFFDSQFDVVAGFDVNVL